MVLAFSLLWKKFTLTLSFNLQYNSLGGDLDGTFK